MQAATRSPFHIASPGTSRPSTGKPSVSTYAGRRSSRASERRSASTLATCMPIRSHSSVLDDHHRPGHRAAEHLLVAALARLRRQQLGVGQAGDLARACPRAGSRPRPRAGRRRRHGRPRRHRRSAPGRPGAARARSRRGRRRGGRSTAGQGAHRRSRPSSPVAGTSSKVAGGGRTRPGPRARSAAKTLPTTRSSSTNRPGAAHVSPGVEGEPAVVAHHPQVVLGHLDVEACPTVASPWQVGVSSSGWPLTVIRPLASQHTTRSPPTPITRFTR